MRLNTKNLFGRLQTMRLTLKTINAKTLHQVAVESVVSIERNAPKDAKRWANAVAKAGAELQTYDNWTYDITADVLTIGSRNSDKTYQANGVCQCDAYLSGTPCKHRAAARLLKNYAGLMQA